ncbi:amidase family protein [Azospirillum sp. TSA6c]|uniref:amidase family protein n=1 Tax=unclassified Azospirillum TaxID=2630922 RepID=UPI0018EE58F5|nr:amidase family protein [Azospirillum sp. TSA6c]
MHDFLFGKSALELEKLLFTGAVTPFHLLHATLRRIASSDPAIFTQQTVARAEIEATAASKRYLEGRPLSILDGVPVAWKDLFDVQGEVTRAGSLVLDNGPALRDAELVRRIAACGAVTAGKLNMTEFAFSGLGLNPHFGTPRNPWSCGEDRIPGGSSSGSAVAVALGLVPIAIGTDTSGSVRIPAAFNGVVGYKPSGGRWPLEGAFPLSRTLDTAGVLTRTVADAIAVDAAACGLPPSEVLPHTDGQIRLVVPTNAVWESVDADVATNFKEAVRRLEDFGVRIEHRRLPALDEVLSVASQHGALVGKEAFELHRSRLASPAAERMDPRVRTRMLLGNHMSTASEAIVRQARLDLIDAMADLFDGTTFVGYPTVAIAAPLLGPLEIDDHLFATTNMLVLRNTLIGSFLDWCGISIPNGFDDNGIPTGFLLSGGPGSDHALLALATRIETIIRGGQSFDIARRNYG